MFISCVYWEYGLCGCCGCQFACVFHSKFKQVINMNLISFGFLCNCGPVRAVKPLINKRPASNLATTTIQKSLKRKRKKCVLPWPRSKLQVVCWFESISALLSLQTLGWTLVDGPIHVEFIRGSVGGGGCKLHDLKHRQRSFFGWVIS